MSAHKRLRERREAEQAELKRVTSPTDVSATCALSPIPAPPFGDPR
jgi:hypothetical protein